MKDQTQERWFQLSQLAHLEQDPEKLLALTTEISRLLDDQQKARKRLKVPYPRLGDGSISSNPKPR